MFDDLAVYCRLTRTATAYVTIALLFNVEFFDSHFISARHLHLMAAALGQA